VEELLRDTVDTISTTPFCLLVMEPMETLELTTGFSRTLGELLGVKMVTLELREPQRNTQLEHAEFVHLYNSYPTFTPPARIEEYHKHGLGILFFQ